MTGGASPAGSGWLLLGALIILVVGVVAVAHWPVLSAQAVCFDDEQFLHDNPLVRQPGWSSVGRFFREILEPSTVRGYAIPLTMTSLMLDYAAGGRPEALRAFHTTNLILHLLCCVLIILLLQALFRQPVLALLGGLLFGVHPLTVEPVAWLAERKTVLATLFALGSLVTYVRHARSGRGFWWGISLLAYLLALLSKPTVALLPLLLVLLDLWPLRRPLLRELVPKIPFFVLAVIFGGITLWSHARTAEIGVHLRGEPLNALLTIGHLNLFYLGKAFWPAALSPVYELPDPLSWENPQVLWGLIGSTILLVILLISLRWTRALLIGWLFFFVTIFPTMGTIRFSWVVASDKYMYLPMLGLLMAAISALAAVWRRGLLVRVVVVALILLLAGFGARGVRAQLGHWQDTIGLHQHMLAHAPGSPEVHTNLGVALVAAGRIDEGLAHYRRALEIDPGHVKALNNLGCILAERGYLVDAEGYFRDAIRIHPEYAEAHFNLGNTLLEQGRFAEATRAYERAVAIRPLYAQAHHNLGRAQQGMGDQAGALRNQRRAAEVDPDLADAQNALALLLLQEGRLDEALERFRAALRLRPHWVTPQTGMAWILATHPDPTVRDAETAIAIAEGVQARTGHEYAGTLDALAAAYAAAGYFDRALATAGRALELVEASDAEGIAESIRQRIALYARGEPYRSSLRRGRP